MATRKKGTGRRRRAGTGNTSERARASTANGSLGRRFAELLADPDSHQLGVCAQLGINWRTHMRWMADEAKPGTPLANYQGAILRALDEQRRSDLEAAQTKLDGCHPAKAAAQFNLFRFRHENRFKRFYADDEAVAKKVELSGPDGGPMKAEGVQYVIYVPEEEKPDGDEGAG